MSIVLSKLDSDRSLSVSVDYPPSSLTLTLLNKTQLISIPLKTNSYPARSSTTKPDLTFDIHGNKPKISLILKAAVYTSSRRPLCSIDLCLVSGFEHDACGTSQSSFFVAPNKRQTTVHPDDCTQTSFAPI
ncbi:hypothetical protein MANES_11G096300v8 [Manihot esculenta]|nr:hypothetical protein MANES_11G096300v8 [Manihot esculenta]